MAKFKSITVLVALILLLLSKDVFCEKLRIGFVRGGEVIEIMPEYYKMNLEISAAKQKALSEYNEEMGPAVEKAVKIKTMVEAASGKEREKLDNDLQNAGADIAAIELIRADEEEKILKMQEELYRNLRIKLSKIGARIAKEKGLIAVIEEVVVWGINEKYVVDVTEEFKDIVTKENDGGNKE